MAASNDGLGGSDSVGSTCTVFWGSPYNDAFIGSSNAEYFDGGSGNDSIFGDAGNDTLFGYLGTDSLNGGDGDDLLISYETPAHRDLTVKGGNGVDTLQHDSADDDLPPIWDAYVEVKQLI